VCLLFKLFLVWTFRPNNETNVVKLPILWNEHLALNLSPLSQTWNTRSWDILVDIFLRIKSTLSWYRSSKRRVMLLNLNSFIDIEIIIGIIILAYVVIWENSSISTLLMLLIPLISRRFLKSLLTISTVLRSTTIASSILIRILFFVEPTLESPGWTTHTTRTWWIWKFWATLSRISTAFSASTTWSTCAPFIKITIRRFAGASMSSWSRSRMGRSHVVYLDVFTK